MFGIRGASRAATTSKMERFLIIVNDWKPLTIITKSSILDVAAALDPPLGMVELKAFRVYGPAFMLPKGSYHNRQPEIRWIFLNNDRPLKYTYN